MRHLAIIIAILFSLPNLLISGVTFESDTIKGGNNNALELKLNIDELDSESELEFDLIVSNPSVCTITSISANEHILTSSITNNIRGYFSFRMTVDSEVKEIILLGKLLSGNDSTCTISLENVVINGNPSSSDTLVLQNTLAYSVGPYLRFLYNSAPFPNPLKSGEISTITIFNDKDISIDVYIHDIKGQPYDYKKIDYKKGENNIEFSTDGYAAGTYYISGFSELGNFFEKIVVYK